MGLSPTHRSYPPGNNACLCIPGAQRKAALQKLTGELPGAVLFAALPQHVASSADI